MTITTHRYHVYNAENYDPATSVPAARCLNLESAKEHADSVTYKMAVIDSLAESRGFIYCNWAPGVILDNADLTHLSLGDVRSAHESLEEMVEQVYADNIDIFFDLPDKLETIRNLLHNVLQRHRVVTVEKIGECIEKRTEVIL